MPDKSINFDHLTLGVCYYPEHWPETLWESDLARMLESGVEIIRIAEFAWNKFEPREDEFTFEFFDRFIETVSKTPMKIIFCTPTATPPAWLTDAHPETLNVTRDGTIIRHGLRRHYNYNCEYYRERSAVITEKLAGHYGNHPSIIGWQIDNELNCETDVFYSDADHAAFRTFLKEKYKTIDALNDAWGTVFWNQTYNDFEQIYLSRPTVNGGVNPHLALDEKRFISHSAISFCALQANILRKYIAKHQFITTNGYFGHLDSHEMTRECLDFLCYDSYPNFAYDVKNPRLDGLRDRAWSKNLTFMRSISPNFGVMEQQSGPNGWVDRMAAAAPRPGQMRLWTMQSVAHGADFISYFRWRTSPMNMEIYWHGILDWSNRDNRRLGELKRINDDFRALSQLAGSRYKAGVAIVMDYDNQWDGENDVWHGPLRRFSENGWFTALQKRHVPMDILCMDKTVSLEKLLSYKFIIYPHATILTEKTANLLTEYAMRGGTVIMGARTGYKDETGKCPMRPMPGPAAPLCGAEVEDFTFLPPGEGMVFIDWNGARLEAAVFNDLLIPGDGGETVGVFADGCWYKGRSAVVKKSYGKGSAYYFGCGFSEQAAGVICEKLGIRSPGDGIFTLPEGVEFAVRRKGNDDYIFILNYQNEEVVAGFECNLLNILTGETLSGKVIIEPFGVLVLKAL